MPPLQVHRHHMATQVRMLPPHSHMPRHTVIQWPMRRPHGPLLPWRTRRRVPRPPSYRRASQNGTLGLSATTRLDVSQQGRIVCDEFTLRYENL
jgi:hypothetical protein